MSRLAYFARETLISLRRNLLMTIAGIILGGLSPSVWYFSTSSLYARGYAFSHQRRASPSGEPSSALPE